MCPDLYQKIRFEDFYVPEEASAKSTGDKKKLVSPLPEESGPLGERVTSVWMYQARSTTWDQSC